MTEIDGERPSRQRAPLALRSRRRALALLAGLGAGAATISRTAGTASAAAGDTLLLGRDNDSGDSTTVLMSSSEAGTLSLGNSLAGDRRSPALVVDGEARLENGFVRVTNSRVMVAVRGGNALSAETAPGIGKEATIVAADHTANGAIMATSEKPGYYGVALAARGSVQIQPGAGVVTVPAGAKSVDVTFDKRLAQPASSFVLATIQGAAGVAVSHARIISARRVRITLTQAAAKPVRVGYLVLN